MSEVRTGRKSNQSGIQPVWHTALCLQKLQPQIHAQRQDAGVSGGDAAAGDENSLLRCGAEGPPEKVLGLGKNTVLNWIKKTAEELLKSEKLLPETFELDEIKSKN